MRMGLEGVKKREVASIAENLQFKISFHVRDVPGS